MNVEIKHWNTDVDGELTETTMREKLERMGYHVSRYEYPPGISFPGHAHDVDKIDGVLSGQFLMRVEGVSVVLNVGDMLILPRGVVHSAEVVGDEPVVSLDAIKC